MKKKTFIFALLTIFVFGLTSCEKEELNDTTNSIENNDEELFSSDKGQNLPPGSTPTDEDEDHN